MKIVLAIDSFKGCLTSEEVEQAVAQCLSAKFANSLIDSIPIADGGYERYPHSCNTLKPPIKP